MAKAKKSDSESTGKAAKPAAKAAGAKTAGAKAPAKAKASAKTATHAETSKTAKKTAKPATKADKKTPAPASSSLIDTNLAAQAAASMVLNRGSAALPTPAGTAGKESASFKAFKQGLNKPQGPGGVLGGSFQQKKGVNQPFGGGKQVGHNQTFGADVTRTGVPRRTSGG